MKKVILFLVAVLVSVVFIACSSDDDDNFNYEIEQLIGKWQITHVEMEGQYVDVTKPPYYPIIPSTYAIFKADGSYSGSGYFGTGSGTYKAKGKTVACYIEGIEYVRYDILNLTGAECELKMSIDGNSVKIKCKKQ